MNQDVKEIGLYMAAFAEEVLCDALTEILHFISQSDSFSQTYPNQFRLGISAVAAAHGAEILIKSVLANEHPLLQFDSKMYQRKLPANDQVELEHLFENQTISFSDLPYALWAATGYKITEVELFKSFVKLRNKIQHLSVPPQEEVLSRTLSFLFLVVDPILRYFWKNDLMNLIRPYGIGDYIEQLNKRKISFSPPEWMKDFNAQKEQDELTQLQELANKQAEIAKRINRNVTEWFIHLSLILPDASLDVARREVIRITGSPAEKFTFSIPLSSTGNFPATHYGAHTAANLDIAVRHVKLCRHYGGSYAPTLKFSGTPEEKQIDTFESHCQRLGLKRIEKPDL